MIAANYNRFLNHNSNLYSIFPPHYVSEIYLKMLGTVAEFPSVNVYRDKFTEISKNVFLEISREKREKLFLVGFEKFSIEISVD
jgi:hypothetical protein